MKICIVIKLLWYQNMYVLYVQNGVVLTLLNLLSINCAINVSTLYLTLLNMGFFVPCSQGGRFPPPVDLEIYKSYKLETLHTYSPILYEQLYAKIFCLAGHVTALWRHKYTHIKKTKNIWSANYNFVVCKLYFSGL